MFRIKTDIRQYKCESREKVERLIRNWVVRPTDLIFDDEKQEWGPIGEHSEFVSTFAELAKREEQAPDTVVSSEPPPAVDSGLGEAADGESDEEEEGAQQDDELDPPEPPDGVEQGSAEPDEITVMTEETLESILEEGEESGGDVDVVQTRATEPEEEDDESTIETEAPEEKSEKREETQPEAPRPRMEQESESRESTRVEEPGETGDLETVSGESTVDEESAPESTEVVDPDERDGFPPLSENGEVGAGPENAVGAEEAEANEDVETTGPTGEDPPEPPDPPEGTVDPTAEDREPTRVEVPDDPSDPNAPQIAAGGEAEPVEGPDDSEVASPGAPPPEARNETTREAGDPAPDPDVSWPEADAREDEQPVSDGASVPPEADDDLSADDELRDTDEYEEDAAEKGAKLASGPNARNRPQMPKGNDISGNFRSTRNEGKLGRHDLPEEMFATDELDDAAEDAGTPDYGPAQTDDSDSVDYEEVEEALQENARAARQKHVDDEWDEILERLRETDELSKEEIEEITKTRDQIAIGRDEGEDQTVPEEDVAEEIEEYVSEGYNKELPIEVGPTSRDVQLGLRRSRASGGAKDRVFPYPRAKREGEVQTRAFELEAGRDHSVAVIAALVGFIVGLVMLAVIAF